MPACVIYKWLPPSRDLYTGMYRCHVQYTPLLPRPRISRYRANRTFAAGAASVTPCAGPLCTASSTRPCSSASCRTRCFGALSISRSPDRASCFTDLYYKHPPGQARSICFAASFASLHGHRSCSCHKHSEHSPLAVKNQCGMACRQTKASAPLMAECFRC